MGRPTLEPVTASSLGEFCAFLNRNLNASMSEEAFRAGLTRAWHIDAPNHGFIVRDDGRIVGGIGAIYAERVINGRPERFCNITGWCVLESHRPQSMRLAMAVTSQSGWHFTDFSPTKVVGSMLGFLKFKPLDERQLVVLNLPTLPVSGAQVVSAPNRIEAELEALGDAATLQAYRDHRDIPWLSHRLVGKPGDWCHVVYKKGHFKGFPSAVTLHISHPDTFIRHHRVLGAHLLLRGMISMQVEYRRIGRPLWPSAIRSGFNAKMVLSQTLSPDQIDLLYSESVALDLN